MPQLPSGTVTFVFSDIEGSTALLKKLGDEPYTELLGRHRRLLRETFAAQGGQEIDTQGDAFFYSFTRARAAVAAAVAVQRAHHRQAWPQDATVRIRLGLHTGEPAVGDEGYTGLDVVRASRIAAAGRGGQVLLSDATRAIVAGDLPAGVELRSLGQQRLKDIEAPELLSELLIADAPVPAEKQPSAELQPAAPPEAPFAELVPGLAGLVPSPSQLPAWVRGATDRLLPAGNRLIEERVLAEIEQSVKERSAAREQRRGKRRRIPALALEPAGLPEGQPASLADELAKLQALREAGALTEAQYQRALERALSNDR
jgi:class 3 adenylate cyclase